MTLYIYIYIYIYTYNGVEVDSFVLSDSSHGQ